MTKFQKQMLTIAAAGALTAVTALPAMAFENEFHGMFAVKTFLGNADQTTGIVQYQKGTKTFARMPKHFLVAQHEIFLRPSGYCCFCHVPEERAFMLGTAITPWNSLMSVNFSTMIGKKIVL